MKSSHKHLCNWGKFSLFCENSYFSGLDETQAANKQQTLIEWGCLQLSQIPEIERVGFVSFDALNTVLSSPICFRVNWGTMSFFAISSAYDDLKLLPENSELDASYIQNVFNLTTSLGIRIYNIVIPAALFNKSPLKLKSEQTKAYQAGIIEANHFFKVREQLLSNQVLIANMDMSSVHKNGTEEARRAYVPEVIRRLSQSGLTPVLLMNKQAAADLGYTSLCEVIDSVDDTRQFHSILFTSPLTAEIFNLLHRSVFSYLYFFDIIATDIQITPLNALGTVMPYLDEFMLCSNYSTRQVSALYPEASSILSTGYLPIQLPERKGLPVELEKLPKFHFVVGNAFAHKLLKPSLNFLCRAFPETQFVALGKLNEYEPHANLHVFQSSVTSDDVVDALYQYAESIIYPSVYEGLGYPWIKGLGIGKHVWVYDSTLIDEIIRAYPLNTSRLHRFNSLPELEGQFRQMLDSPPSVPLPSADATVINPHRQHICDMLTQRITHPPSQLRIKKFDAFR